MKQNSVAFRMEAVNSFETMGQTNFPTRCNKAKCYLIATYRGSLKTCIAEVITFYDGYHYFKLSYVFYLSKIYIRLRGITFCL